MQYHNVKSWVQFYQAIKRGEKTHDLRHNDRNYQVGDIINLMEYDPVAGKFTGEFQKAKITYITSHQFPCAFSSAILPKDYCILSLKVEEEEK